MKLLLLFFAGLAFAIKCPFWQCSKQSPSKYCFYQKSSEEVVVNAQFTNISGACFISDLKDMNIPFSRYILAEKQLFQDQSIVMLRIKNRFCDQFKPKYLQDKFECYKYCYSYDEKAQKGVQKKTFCDFQKFQQEQEEKTKSTQRGKQIGWSECDSHQKCDSLNCRCVPKPQGVNSTLGRCTTSIKDPIANEQFYHICKAEVNSDNEEE